MLRKPIYLLELYALDPVVKLGKPEKKEHTDPLQPEFF